MNRKFLIVGFIAAVALAATMTSSGYGTRTVQDCGGGLTASTSFNAKGSIGDSVGGSSGSTSFLVYSGALRHTEQPPESAVVVESVSKGALTTKEVSVIRWHSKINGNYYIELGGNGAPGSGVLISSGVCSANVPIETDIYEAEIPDNQRHQIFIIVDTGSGYYYASVVLFDDQIPPNISIQKITVKGSVDDATVTQVIVNGVSVPIVSGKYEAEVSTALSEIVIEATNSKGQTVKRTIRLW